MNTTSKERRPATANDVVEERVSGGKVEVRIETKDRHRMRRWTDRDGRKWQCNAYDHGPFCRRCVRLSRLTPHQARMRLNKLGWQHEHGRSDEGDFAVRVWNGPNERSFHSPYFAALDVLYDDALIFVASFDPPSVRARRGRQRDAKRVLSARAVSEGTPNKDAP